MFQKMTIRNHFLLLIYTIAFALIITGFLGLKSMYNLHDASSRIYQEHFAPLKELFSLESETLIPLKQTIIQGKEKEEAIVLAQKFLTQFDFFSSNYKKFIKNTHLDKFSLLATQLQQQISTIQTSEELSKITSQLLLEVDVLIDTLVKEKYPEIEAQHTAMALSYPLQCTILAIVILLAGTLLALVSYPFIKELMRSMNTIIDGMKSFVSEDPDLTQRLSTHREDEIGQIAHHFNRLIDNLSDLIKRVQRSGIQVFGSATSISAASKQLESTVHHFTSFTGEIVTTAKTISQGSQNLVLTMTEVKHVANDTAALAGAGKEGLTQIESTISHMEEAFKAISSKLGTISEKAANITNVVTTITKIADQTNLLSLNASIEAEKAGEFGLGFAVIARETRRLADQTAVATLDIDKMVSEMKSSVSSGVMSIENFSRQLNQYVDDVRKIASQQAQIILHVQELTPQFERVHSVMQSQATGAGQITDAMVELSGMAQKSVEALKNSTLAIEQLNAAARGLQKEVSHFKVQN